MLKARFYRKIRKRFINVYYTVWLTEMNLQLSRWVAVWPVQLAICSSTSSSSRSQIPSSSLDSAAASAAITSLMHQPTNHLWRFWQSNDLLPALSVLPTARDCCYNVEPDGVATLFTSPPKSPQCGSFVLHLPDGTALQSGEHRKQRKSDAN